jgi:hypothetical protein
MGGELSNDEDAKICEMCGRLQERGKHRRTPRRSARMPLALALGNGQSRSTLMPNALSPELLRKMHAYWRAANFLSVGQIYLKDNPLLESPLTIEHVKPRL